MKKQLFAAFLFAGVILTGCKEDEQVVTQGTPYPTDALVVSKDPTALLQLTTGAWCQYCPNGGERLIQAKVKHGAQVIAMVTRTGSDPLVNALTDSLNEYFPSSGVPNFYVNQDDASQSPSGPLEFALAFPAPLGVAHAITTTDTGYVVDVKVEVFESMKDQQYFVQSYLVLDAIEARNFGAGNDMRQTSSVPTVDKGQDVSRWIRDAAEVDGVFQVRVGDPYVHSSNFYAKAVDTELWGINLNDINPFKDQYIEGDLLGTRYTPIRLILEKQNIAPIVCTKYAVTTIVWKQREGDGNENKRDFVAGYTSTITTP
jgi:hypothetical protein